MKYNIYRQFKKGWIKMKILFNEGIQGFNKGDVLNYTEESSNVILFKNPEDLAYNGKTQKMSIYNLNRLISSGDVSTVSE